MFLQEVDFIAVLKYRTTEEGGRIGPVFSGYRPHIKFDFAEMQTSGEQRFIDKKIVYPGDTTEAEIRLLSVDFLKISSKLGWNLSSMKAPETLEWALSRI